MVEVRPQPRSKRVLDVSLAVVGLILSSPIWLIVMIAILAEREGSIFYRQRRWGLGGTSFDVLKFRTMIKESDALYGIKPASRHDHRVTVVGRFLRGTGIDELPQLLNILRGEMSLVGPRALAVGEELPGYSGVGYDEAPGFLERLSVRPGLTSPATIQLPKDARPAAKFHLDLKYIRTQTTWNDLKLIALSLWISLRGRWEVRENKI